MKHLHSLLRKFAPAAWVPLPRRPLPRLSRNDWISARAKFDGALRRHIDGRDAIVKQIVSDAQFISLADGLKFTKKRGDYRFFYADILVSLLQRMPYDHIVVFETGTAHGFSSTLAAHAIDGLGKKGMVVTLDMLPVRRPIFWGTQSDLVAPVRRSQLVIPYLNDNVPIIFLEGWLESLVKTMWITRIDVAVIDAQHNYAAVCRELDFVCPVLSPKGAILVDDYHDGFPGVVRAVNQKVKEWNLTLNSFGEGRDQVVVLSKS